MQRLDLIRIRLLRLQLNELHKIKSLLEKRMTEQHEAEQKRILEQQKEIERLKEVERQIMIGENKRQQKQKQMPQLLEEQSSQPTRCSRMNPDSTFIMEDSRENEENVAPTAYYTPEEEKTAKETRYRTIQEEEQDDLIPAIKTTPPRSHPRQSIGQWSVERAKNNMSVRSLISSLEDKTGPRGNMRSRMLR